jgi:hypothetical protein
MREWVLPDAVLNAAPVSPWGFPSEPFRTRAERATPGALSFANRRARDALGVGGTVVDVGVGAGAASLPLVGRCSLIVGVDASAEMLAEFRHQAERVNVAVHTINGASERLSPTSSCATTSPTTSAIWLHLRWRCRRTRAAGW